MDEDDIEIESTERNEKVLKSYRASRYIRKYYKTQDGLIEELFDKKIITYKLVGEVLGFSETVVRNTITKKTKNPQPEVRHAIDMFFDKDFYKELGRYANLCSKCTKRCKQHYFAEVRCKKYKEKK